MISQTQPCLINTQIVHVPLIPLWKDFGIEKLELPEVQRVKKLYERKIGFVDRSDLIRDEKIDDRHLLLHKALSLFNRECTVTFSYRPASGIWEASVKEPVRYPRDATNKESFNAPLGELFQHYFRLAPRSYSHLASL